MSTALLTNLNVAYYGKTDHSKYKNDKKQAIFEDPSFECYKKILEIKI